MINNKKKKKGVILFALKLRKQTYRPNKNSPKLSVYIKSVLDKAIILIWFMMRSQLLAPPCTPFYHLHIWSDQC